MTFRDTWDTREAQEHYTLRDMAEILRGNKEHLRKKLIKTGRITYHRERPGGRILIAHNDFMAYLRSIRIEAVPTDPACNTL